VGDDGRGLPHGLRGESAERTAKGGGYIFQSDHSVPSNISGRNDDYVVKLVREFGNVFPPSHVILLGACMCIFMRSKEDT